MLISSFVVRKHHKSVILKAINTGTTRTCSGLLCPSCSCVQLYLDYRDTPLPPAGYTSLDRHFAETTENFQLLVIWNLTIPGIRMIFRFFNWRLRSRLCFTEFCSDTNLEVSKIIWNRKMISISQTHFLTVSMSGFLLGTCWVLELFYRQEVSGEVRQITICISSISNISILPVP